MKRSAKIIKFVFQNQRPALAAYIVLSALFTFCFAVSLAVKWVANPALTIERNVNREGATYSTLTFETYTQPQVCQAACLEDQRCRSWVFSKPGIVSAGTNCQLKDAVPPENFDGRGRYSGVVRP